MNVINVSIVIPVYNVVRFLRETLISVLSQRYPGVEIIVVNDGSTPKATEALKELCAQYPEVTLLHQANSCQAIARRTGVRHARGRYVMFLDADDLLFPYSIAHLVGTLEERPDAIASYGTKVLIDEQGRVLDSAVVPSPEIACSGDVLPSLLTGAPIISNGNICMRREAIARVSFPPRLKQGEDWVTWCRLALLGDVIFAGNTVVLAIRQHRYNTSKQAFKQPRLLFDVLDVMFHDPIVGARIGNKQLEHYRWQHTRRIHQFLYYHYRAHKRHVRAVWHNLCLKDLQAPPA